MHEGHKYWRGLKFLGQAVLVALVARGDGCAKLMYLRQSRMANFYNSQINIVGALVHLPTPTENLSNEYS